MISRTVDTRTIVTTAAIAAFVNIDSSSVATVPTDGEGVLVESTSEKNHIRVVYKSSEQFTLEELDSMKVFSTPDRADLEQWLEDGVPLQCRPEQRT